MLAYISPSTSNSTHNSPTIKPRASTTTPSGGGSNSHTPVRVGSPMMTTGGSTSSPRFTPAPVNQPAHPSTPPPSAIAPAFPRSKTLATGAGKIPRLSLEPATNVGRIAQPQPPRPAASTYKHHQRMAAAAVGTLPAGSRSKRCDNLVAALKEFESILMGDDDVDAGSSDEDDDPFVESDESASSDEFVATPLTGMDALKSISEDNKATIKEIEVKPHSSSGAATAATTNKRPARPWSSGVAREFSRFQLVVDIPVWDEDCIGDLSTLHQLRDTTLRALHTIIDNLRLRGVHTTYRICSTTPRVDGVDGSTSPSQGPSAPLWGCIRVAPPFSTPLSRLGPTFGGGVGGKSGVASSQPAGGNTGAPSARLPMRRSTIAPGSGPAMAAAAAGQMAGTCRTLEIAKIIREELEADKEARKCLWVEEGQSFIVGLHGQPALVLT